MTTYSTVAIRRGLDRIAWLNDVFTGLDMIVAGGYARYCATPQHIPMGSTKVGHQPDIDLFPYAEGVADEAIRRLVDRRVRVKYVSDYATTFYWPDTQPSVDFTPDIQIIHWHRDWHSVEDILDSFDFANSAAALVSAGSALVHPLFWEAEDRGELRIVFIDDPVRSLKRLLKYAAKGYRIPYAELVRLFIEWDRKPATYRERAKVAYHGDTFADLTVSDKVDLYTAFSVKADIEPVAELQADLPF